MPCSGRDEVELGTEPSRVAGASVSPTTFGGCAAYLGGDVDELGATSRHRWDARHYGSGAARPFQLVALHLAYRWFCRLDLDDKVPDHSTFSVNRHGRFRDSDLFRQIFEAVVSADRTTTRLPLSSPSVQR